MKETEEMIEWTLGKLFGKWVSHGVVSEYWTKELNGYYRQLEMKQLLARQ